MDEKYKEIKKGEIRTYTFQVYIIGLPIKKGSLRLRIAWDDKKLFIRQAKWHDGKSFVEIPEIITYKHIPYSLEKMEFLK